MKIPSYRAGMSPGVQPFLELLLVTEIELRVEKVDGSIGKVENGKRVLFFS